MTYPLYQSHSIWNVKEGSDNVECRLGVVVAHEITSLTFGDTHGMVEPALRSLRQGVDDLAKISESSMTMTLLE